MCTIQCQIIDEVRWQNPEDQNFMWRGSAVIWRIPLSTHFPLLDELMVKYPHEEDWPRANRFIHEEDRRRFILGKLVSRYLLGKYLAVDPFAIRYKWGPNKKPDVLFPANSGIHFNISHSGQWLLFAVGPHALGVDVEEIDHRFNYQELLESCFSEKEIEFIVRQPDPAAAFYDFWTRKESLVKALGTGLDHHLPDITCMDGINAVKNNIPALSANWRINSFKVQQTHAAAIATSPAMENIFFYELSKLEF